MFGATRGRITQALEARRAADQVGLHTFCFVKHSIAFTIEERPS
jgi:hypothetical protein